MDDSFLFRKYLRLLNMPETSGKVKKNCRRNLDLRFHIVAIFGVQSPENNTR